MIPFFQKDSQASGAIEKNNKIKSLLSDLYGKNYNINSLLDRFNQLCFRYNISRPQKLKELDSQTSPDWYKNSRNVAYILYADLFTPDVPKGQSLKGVKERLGYLEDLGITLLHILPVLKNSGDAGYAVDDYRQIDPRFGTMDDFINLVNECHTKGIKIALDFVLNHTSDIHHWALAAKKNDAFFKDFYIFSEDGEDWLKVPNHTHDFSPRHWDYVSQLNQYVWSSFFKRNPKSNADTKFNFAQWDLNYKNPEVFLSMLENLLFLANLGVDIFRLDAVALLWKEKGTDCKNLPQTHALIKLFRLGLEMVSPRSIFLSEVYDSKDIIASYFSEGDETHTTYFVPLMIALWKAAVSQNPKIIEDVVKNLPQIPDSCQWVTFLECHDSIEIHRLDEETARTLYNYFTQSGGISSRLKEGKDYSGSVAGTTYSLLRGNTDLIVLIESVKLTIGGIPIFYMGEELGTENDLSFRNDPEKKNDNRFVKRVPIPDEMKLKRNKKGTKEEKIFTSLKNVIVLRKRLSGSVLPPQFFDTGNEHVLGYIKKETEEQTIYLANFSDQPQTAVLPDGSTKILKPYQFEAL